jgi:triosephosphate isomerase
MAGNVDAVLFTVGFIVGAACIVMLGGSLLEDHDKRIVVPATVVGAIVGGGILGWSFNYFFHFAQQGP